ncbi:hypothetical protein V3C99_001755 [Haemonchus contortus]|uniref:CHCH domain-containing protein n=1 Tax=Haemonchus contortus TaxID=6289 RepID=A0A7I4YBP1_HAECO|nr:CHCH domain containing protein [Haemonchus contortus]CDJ97678.1 CHCH domain containing protein [Haemonchus contortus]
MVRRRTASPKPSGPVRRASPPPSAMRAAPPPAPMPSMPARTAAPPMGATAAAPSQGPGLMAQMAATAGGVAIGSAVGHAVGNMFTGGGGSSAEAAPVQSAPQGAPQQQAYSQPCEFEWKQFIDCTQNQSDVSLCNGFNEAFKECKARYVSN